MLIEESSAEWRVLSSAAPPG